MSLLTYHDLCDLVERGVVQNSSREHISAASIDVHISDKFLLERLSVGHTPVVDVAARQSPDFTEIIATADAPLYMMPGQFLLAATCEVFNLPDDVAALFVMKSSVARCGLDQMNAAWCNPGWRGSALTLELMNVMKGHMLMLRPGMPIGQMVFFRGKPVPQALLYSQRGVYNHQREVSRAVTNGGKSVSSS